MSVFENLDIYVMIIEVCKPFGIDPMASIELEQYFEEMLKEYRDDFNNPGFRDWLARKVKENFQVVDKRPEWIQNPDWPIVKGNPAIFLSQLDLTYDKNSLTANLFHDDVSFYLFLGQDGLPLVKMQQF